MAISVTRFMVTNNLLSIDLDVEINSGQTVTKLLLWDQNTYRDPSKSVNLTSLLSGSTNTAKLIANIDLSCLNCNTNFQNALLFDLYLEATKQALLLGRYQDAIDNLAKLIITVDTSDCDACNDIEPLISTAGNIVSVGVLDCIIATS